jgi:hypothetical protein
MIYIEIMRFTEFFSRTDNDIYLLVRRFLSILLDYNISHGGSMADIESWLVFNQTLHNLLLVFGIIIILLRTQIVEIQTWFV